MKKLIIFVITWGMISVNCTVNTVVNTGCTEDNVKRCSGSDLQICENSNWRTIETCGSSSGECVERNGNAQCEDSNDDSIQDNIEEIKSDSTDFDVDYTPETDSEGEQIDSAEDGQNDIYDPCPIDVDCSHSLVFDSTDNDWLSLPLAAFNDLSQGTMELWIKRSGRQSDRMDHGASGNFYGTFFSKQHGYVDTYGHFGFDSDGDSPKVKFSLKKGYFNTNSLVVGTSIIPDEQWTHLAVTWNGSNVSLYVNGSLDTSINSTHTIPDALGADFCAVGKSLYASFNGKIAEIRIWSVARTETEIQAAMNGPVLPDNIDLVTYVKMAEGEGQVASDSTINSFDGVLGTSEQVESNDPAWDDDIPF